jgi:hypothetical protein
MEGREGERRRKEKEEKKKCQIIRPKMLPQEASRGLRFFSLTKGVRGSFHRALAQWDHSL